jgi:hypothetical protein
MSASEALAKVIEEIGNEPRLACTGPWAMYKDRWLALPIRAILSVDPIEHMPSEAAWFLVVDTITQKVEVHPAKAGGITVTFQHQTLNEEGSSDYPWRTGNVCLDRQSAAFGRNSWSGEPEAMDEKINWRLTRLLTWIDAAATGHLAVAGEPLELPAGLGRLGYPTVGFIGADDDMAFWPARQKSWGWADIADISTGKNAHAVTVFRDTDFEPILERKWGFQISNLNAPTCAIWIALANMPVVPPWELPRTWSNLCSRLRAEGVDLPTIMVKAGIGYRRSAARPNKLKLLLGFPLSATIGAPPTRFHWLAIGNVELTDRNTVKDGFRPIEAGWQAIDRARAASNGNLTWDRTVNWESSELRTRSGAPDADVRRRVLLLGAGSLGSAMGENLVRMGLTDIGIMDDDLLDAGNLTRHALGMDAVGQNKAHALANALNNSMPDGNAVGFACVFPPIGEDIADKIRSYDIIIDCSGSDAVLDAMSRFDWKGEKIFVSLAMTWRAEGFLVYTASEASFPAIDAKMRFNAFNVPPSDLDDARIEGIGCWHPVFPASAADVRFWSAVGTKAVLRAIRSPGRTCEYFRQSEDGTVEKVDG